jgi:hypothetical protein
MADKARTMDQWEGDHSLGEILREIVHDVQNMIHAEVRLARAELVEKARGFGKAGGLLGAAAGAALFAGACFVTTCIAALALVLPLWLAALIMALILGFTALGLYAAGRDALPPPVPRQTVQTLEENAEWVKHRVS